MIAQTNVNCNMYPLHLNGTIPGTSTPILLYNTIVLYNNIDYRIRGTVCVFCNSYMLLHFRVALVAQHLSKIATYLINYFPAAKHDTPNRKS